MQDQDKQNTSKQAEYVKVFASILISKNFDA